MEETINEIANNDEIKEEVAEVATTCSRSGGIIAGVAVGAVALVWSVRSSIGSVIACFLVDGRDSPPEKALPIIVALYKKVVKPKLDRKHANAEKAEVAKTEDPKKDLTVVDNVEGN